MSVLSQCGLSPSSVLRALDALECSGIGMHSLLLSKNGRLLFEAYWKPWEKDSLHRVYSITKSVTALAVGCLEKDGLLSLSDRVADYFPEYVSSAASPHLRSVTVRDALMMRTCHRSATYKKGRDGRFVPSWRSDWIRSFFDTPPDHAPGTLFSYDTSAYHVLSALVERLSGSDYLSYLKKRLLCGLDISGRTSVVRDPEGHPCGESGLLMRPLDLLHLLELVMSGLHGIISPSFLRDALSPLSATLCGRGEFESGYGYGFWTDDGGSYAMYGLGGQYAVSYPEKGIAVVTTADTQGTPGGDLLIRHVIDDLVSSVSSQAVEEDKEGEAELLRRISSLSVPAVKGSPFCGMMSRSYVFDGVDGLESIAFSFSLSSGSVIIRTCGSVYEIPFAYGSHVPSSFPGERSSPAFSSAAMLPDGSFLLVSHLFGYEIGRIMIHASFFPGGVTVSVRRSGEVSFRIFEGMASGRGIE